jgi:NADPH:quinone reductase-like Zn-dependent oxidoreductase
MSPPASIERAIQVASSMGCMDRSLRASIGEEIAMRAVTVSEYGGIPVVGEIPTPEPGAGQVLLRMRAAGARVIANVRAAAAGRMRGYGAAETVDHTEVSLPGALREAHPDGIDVLIDLVSDADGFAALAALVRPGGTAVTTKYVADPGALAAAGVTGTNFNFGQHGPASSSNRLPTPSSAGASPRRQSPASPWSKRPLP